MKIGTGMNKTEFKQQLRLFRILTVVGYTLVLLILIGMPVVAARFEQSALPFPAVVPVGIVGVVLMLVVACPFVWAAYDKTICPHCGKRIEEGYWVWHGVRFNGPTRRYWQLFFGRPLRCPHCHTEVISGLEQSAKSLEL